MNGLVTLNNGCPVTTSLAIAEGVERPHKNIVELIRTHTEDFEVFGNIAFETRNSLKGAGRPTEVAILNEHQATLLITFMRNIGVVKEFKKRLVKAFFEMRDQLQQSHSPTVTVDQQEYIDLLKTKIALLESTSPQRSRRPAPRPLSDEEKLTILELDEQGLGKTDIARELGRSRSAVRNVLKELAIQ